MIKQKNVINKPNSDLGPLSFAKGFFDYLINLKEGSSIGDWECDGLTDIAYGTPAGPWTKEGFLFRNKDYTFIIRSIAHPDSSYLVVESVNLGGQLANLALNNEDKFINNRGTITIVETYDMTVGYGRRARSQVREAFIQAGMENPVITEFREKAFSWEQILQDILKWAEFREEAKEILQRDPDSKPNQPEKQYWFLKLNGVNWLPDNLKEGETAFYHADYPSRVERPDYKNFTSVRVGDLGIAADDSEDTNPIFLFEVSRGLQRENDARQRIMFRITKYIDSNTLTPLEKSRLTELVRMSANGDQTLFELAHTAYNDVLHRINLIRPLVPGNFIFNKVALSKVFSDSAGQELEDSLGFEKDIDALASIMVYKEVTPPLAIGLFGNWGSGKSFFMNKLQKKVNTLSVDQGKVFCERVLQINFNSWHYSDSNLWASLVTKIFEELAEFGTDRKNELNDIFGKLNSAKELAAEAELAKSAVDRKIELLNQEKNVFEDQANQQSSKLATLDARKILTGLLENTNVREQIEDLNHNYSFLKLDVYQDINKSIVEVNDLSDRLTKSFQIISSFFTGWRVILTVSSLALIILGLNYLSNISDAVKVLFDQYKWIIYAFGSLLAGGVNILRPAMITVKKVYKQLRSVNTTIDQLRKKADEEFLEQRKLINDQLITAQSASQKLDAEIAHLQVTQQKLQGDIDDISSGKKVIRFIESRVSDERYTNSLGIISWVRKDFEQLDLLLGQQKSASKLQVEGQELPTAVFNLERIILYIDDLDRCAENTVAKVLEAINLLLAFPLFVVVVGVDPRWMHNALHKKYPHLKNGLRKNTNDGRFEEENDLSTSATSSDYLEKIFQIPFALKPMTERSKKKLIEDQLKVKTNQASPQVIKISSKLQSSNDEAKSWEDHGIVVSSDNLEDRKLPEIQPVMPYEIEEEQLPTEVRIDVTRLEISENEISFMKALAFMIGDSPRAIKRFINIYRIIRTHEGFLLEQNQEQSYYYAALIILSIMTGKSKLMDSFSNTLLKSADDTPFITVISESIELNNKDNLSLYDLIDTVGRSSETSSIHEILGLRIKEFKANLELITRFSFSNYATNDH